MNSAYLAVVTEIEVPKIIESLRTKFGLDTCKLSNNHLKILSGFALKFDKIYYKVVGIRQKDWFFQTYSKSLKLNISLKKAMNHHNIGKFF